MNHMDHQEVSLNEMLMARERRVMIQTRLLGDYHVPLVCFTMNIPGPVKVFDNIPEVFGEGCEQIEKVLEQNHISFYLEECIRDKTGYEAFYCVDDSAEHLKQLMSGLEDNSMIGRLYDIDVLRADGRKVSREDFKLPPRKCLLCGESAHSCSRSRRHSVEELTARIREILKNA